MLSLGGLTSRVYAYIDPGTAGYLYQILYVVIGVVVGYFAGFRLLLKKIFRRKKEKANEPQDTANP